ncbi:uncharacterized protein N7477_000398 [Penicillium maclennaniae]|uniref:uncharacterized protein n=1 Tax=Penicillium maclennaniae TaxID=1343394 RepID=UPI00253FD2B1|nr:uncharacterized protein N7477_000398 [Penicillium maclennaniae]KAJ5684053.1 hypothetical protein N7477_000398 [Penicillium maclennaniae]
MITGQRVPLATISNDTLSLLFGQSIPGLPPLLQDLENFEVTVVWNGQWGSSEELTSIVLQQLILLYQPEQMIIAVAKFPHSKSLTVSIPMSLSGMHLTSMHVGEANGPLVTSRDL